MNGKIAVAVLSGALLLSGLLVAISYGEPAETTEPTVLELWWNTHYEDSELQVFLFDKRGGRCGEEDKVCGQITEKDMPLFDVDGNEVGRQHISCIATDRTEWVCHQISVI